MSQAQPEPAKLRKCVLAEHGGDSEVAELTQTNTKFEHFKHILLREELINLDSLKYRFDIRFGIKETCTSSQIRFQSLHNCM